MYTKFVKISVAAIIFASSATFAGAPSETFADASSETFADASIETFASAPEVLTLQGRDALDLTLNSILQPIAGQNEVVILDLDIIQTLVYRIKYLQHHCYAEGELNNFLLFEVSELRTQTESGQRENRTAFAGKAPNVEPFEYGRDKVCDANIVAAPNLPLYDLRGRFGSVDILDKLVNERRRALVDARFASNFLQLYERLEDKSAHLSSANDKLRADIRDLRAMNKAMFE
ncbi:MAG: hypothetical protein LBR89_00550 [Holosporales bacterium]|jgi:hypothetical protein|nr:hypothetical protein [Holosporales bacterium]